jgi:hypothetical protein
MLRINLMLVSSETETHSTGAFVVVVEAVVPCELLVLSSRRHIPECYNNNNNNIYWTLVSTVKNVRVP